MIEAPEWRTELCGHATRAPTQGPIRQTSQLGFYRAGSLHFAGMPSGPKAQNAGGFGGLAPQVLPTRNSGEPI